MDKEGGVSINEFVIQEAKEKSYEIEVRTLKEFEQETSAIVDKEVEVIRGVYEKKAREVETQFKIKRSTSINAARLENMQARNKAMMKLFSDSQFRVLKKIQSDSAFYQKLLVNLMVQGFIKLYGETTVVIRCLKRDLKLCQGAVKEAKEAYVNLVKAEMGKEIKIEAVVEAERFLEERPLVDNNNVPLDNYDVELGAREVISKSQDDKKCFGGIILTNQTGDIIVKNTLDVRCDLAFQDSLPIIREIMFTKAH